MSSFLLGIAREAHICAMNSKTVSNCLCINSAVIGLQEEFLLLIVLVRQW